MYLFRSNYVFVVLLPVTLSLAADPRPRPGDGARMVLVSGGEFRMGAPAEESDARADERPVHRVRVDSFYMDETPVTYRAYRAIVADGARRLPYWKYDSYNRPEQPVSGVTWFDAACYCNWRSAREGRAPAYRFSGKHDAWGDSIWELAASTDAPAYRLPTEAEFEFAARGGLEDRSYPWGADFDPAWANFDEGHGVRGIRAGRWWRLARVKDQRPNDFGLYGMSGNVWEWTGDWYAAYRRSWFGARKNPIGPRRGRTRVLRGGSWGSHRPTELRVARRSFAAPGHYNYDIGFRCVLPAAAQDAKDEDGAEGEDAQGAHAARERDPREICPARKTVSTADLAPGFFDEDFRERLAAYIADRFPESIYFHVRVDQQEILTPRELADLIVDVTTSHDIHPLFLTGIMVSESGLGTVSFPRWFNNPMAYHWGNWKMRYGLPYYEPRKYRNRRYRDLRKAFDIFSRGIRRRLYIRAARRDLYRFHMVYVGYEALEWMNTLSRVYREVAGQEFDARLPARESGRFIYLDWEELR